MLLLSPVQSYFNNVYQWLSSKPLVHHAFDLVIVSINVFNAPLDGNKQHSIYIYIYKETNDAVLYNRNKFDQQLEEDFNRSNADLVYQDTRDASPRACCASGKAKHDGPECVMGLVMKCL